MKKNHIQWALRVILGILILFNMALIFVLSSENATESIKTSTDFSSSVAGAVDKDFSLDTTEKRDHFNLKIVPMFRKLAHMAEFGCLGALIYCFMLTWRGATYLKYAAALLATFLYAVFDEVHQLFIDGRSCSFGDVMIDFSGALITCTVILGICFFVRRDPQKLQVTHYTIPSKDSDVRLRIAVASDLHGNPNELPIALIKKEAPDLILIPGDLMDDRDLRNPNASGYAFLQACAAIAPTYYSIGNHEIACYHKGNPWRHPTPLPVPDEARERIAQTGAILLENDYADFSDKIRICALTSGINRSENKPDAQALARFDALNGIRILLCHHPEYYVPYVQKTSVDLTVCGHAHGGHWRFFGRGVYAPGQGLFPKYTAGVLDQKCVISRGMGNHTRIPRLFNTPELVVIHYGETQNENKKE